jgi:hypothetical protein
VQRYKLILLRFVQNKKSTPAGMDFENVYDDLLNDVFYAGSIASTGQTSAQDPQSVQISGSIL